VRTDKQIIALYDKTCLDKDDALANYESGASDIAACARDLRAALAAKTDAAAVKLLAAGNWTDAENVASSIRRAAGIKADMALSAKKSKCIVCEAPASAELCRSCDRSYDKMWDRTSWALIEWAAKRARAAERSGAGKKRRVRCA